MSAKKCYVIIFQKLNCLFLREHRTLRRHINHVGLFAQILTEGFITIVNGLCLHNHTRAAAVGCIVHPAVLIKGILADIAAIDFNKSLFPCPAEYAFAYNGFAHLGKEGHNINPHRQKSPSTV